VLGRARLYRLREKSISRLILGGAALQRCGKCIVLNAALAAEGAPSARQLVFPQPVQLCRPEPLSEAGLGHISEIFEGDPPHRPVGCIAQAWSVAEVLRAYVEDVRGIRPLAQPANQPSHASERALLPAVAGTRA